MSTLFLPGIAQIKPRGFSSSVIHFFSTRDDLKRPAKTLNPLYQGAKQKVKFDGFVKSPSAALRFTFVVAAYQQVRFTPQDWRALHMELFTLPSQFLLFARPSNFRIAIFWGCGK